MVEYKGIFSIPSQEKGFLKEAIREKDLNLAFLLHQGFGYKANGSIYDITLYSDMTEGQKADARKQNSVWNVVLPMEGTGKKKLHYYGSRHDGDLTRGHWGRQNKTKRRSLEFGATPNHRVSELDMRKHGL